jgi:aspartyl-tRNA(Asn)/glutamyl-tRNA(Gln) amidotransferase subunit A
MPEPSELTVAEASAALTAGELTAFQLASAYLGRIERLDNRINSYTQVLRDRALAEAAAADARREAGRRLGPLDGVPYAVKDNIDVADVLTSDGLGPRGRPPAAADAVVVTRLAAAGAVLLGKLNLHEGALGATTENRHFGPAHNPWRHGFTPGGSSGGSGAAVAARLCAFALGTDTMGSIRLPAAYCGCVGLKQSYGLVSNRGATPACDALDHIGPLARSVGDAALVLQALVEGDAKWPGSCDAPAGWNPLPAELPDLSGVRIGVLDNFAAYASEPAVHEAFSESCALLHRLGARIERLDIAGYEPLPARRAGLLWVEAAAAATHEADLAAYPQAFPPAIRAMLDFGRKLSAARLARALAELQRIAAAFRRAIIAVDAIAAPAAPQLPFAFAGPQPADQAEFAAPANFSGLPALTLPSGITAGGLPLSLQLIGQRFGEARLLSIARVFERAVAFRARPPLADI